MDTYLPMVQATLDAWLQLTLEHPLYVVVLVIGIWLLVAILYSFKTAGLNKKYLVSEQARVNAESQRHSAEQQLEQVQAELIAINQQLNEQQKSIANEQQRVLNAEQKLAQRNQQIASLIQRLALQFDIGETPIQVGTDLNAEQLWQQHDKVLNKLIDVVRAEQQAKTELEKFYQAGQTKLADAEARLSSLQTTLDNQSNLVLSLQQQQMASQQALTDALNKQRTDAERLITLEQQLATVKTDMVTPVAETVKPVIAEAVSSFSTATDSIDNLKNLFKKPTAKSEPLSKPVDNEASIVTDVLVTRVESPVLNEIASANQAVESTDEALVEPVAELEQTDKDTVLKGLYNKLTSKKSVDEAVSEEATIPTTSEETTEKTGAVKGLFKKFTASKTETPDIVSEVNVEPQTTVDNTENSNGVKGLLQKFTTKKVEPAVITPEPIIVQPEPTITAEVVQPEPEPLQTIAKPVETTVEPPKKIVKPRPRPMVSEQRKIDNNDNDSSGRMEVIADQITDALDGLKKLFSRKTD